MDKEDIGQIIEIIDQAEDFKPIAKKAIDIITMYKDDIGVLVNMLVVGIANSKMKMLNTYLSAGLSREEALILTVNSFDVLKNLDSLNRMNQNKK